MKDELLTEDIKDVMRENAHNLVEIMLLEQVPFRLVLWNNDNWNKDLPDEIMKNFPSQILLDIKEAALEESYIDEATGEIIITTNFYNEEYMKVLEFDEIVAVLDLTGQPYILNNFQPEEKIKETPEEFLSFVPKTVDELVEMAVAEGIPAENAEKSINAFMKNNPDLRERFGVK